MDGKVNESRGIVEQCAVCFERLTMKKWWFSSPQNEDYSLAP